MQVFQPSALWSLFYLLQVKEHLKDDFHSLAVHCEGLPLGEGSPAYPFTGFVLNICVATSGHRDSGDLRLCVVMPFGNWMGGELCLYELRLVFEAGPGDLVIFPSCEITHFNLHMTGERCSLVLQTDKGMGRWKDFLNHWDGHIA